MEMMTRYWKLTEDSDPTRGARWELAPSWPFEQEYLFRQCKRIEDWNVDESEVYCNPTDHFEDMPFSLDGTMIVSDRFKRLLEREVPGDVQYLPVRMSGPGARGFTHEYWVLNILRELECLDKARSFNEREDRDGPFVEIPVIDPSRIPLGVRLGRLKEYRVIALVRDDLKQIIENAGITGPAFFHIWHSHDDGAPPPVWKPGVRRD